jgi:SAM-dependent methyltransferase
MVFLPRVLFPGAKVLDVGCASGGFFNIMRTLEPLIEYTGVDIAEPAIALARQKYPDTRFEVTEGSALPFADDTFDIVHCTKVLVIEPRYQEVLKEMYRVSNRFVIADLRLLKGIGNERDFQNSFYKVQLNDDRVEFTVPYVVNDADEVANFILQLEPKPKALRGTGYFHQVAEEAVTPYGEVCMTMLLVQKGGSEDGATVIDLHDLPIEFSISES